MKTKLASLFFTLVSSSVYSQGINIDCSPLLPQKEYFDQMIIQSFDMNLIDKKSDRLFLSINNKTLPNHQLNTDTICQILQNEYVILREDNASKFVDEVWGYYSFHGVDIIVIGRLASTFFRKDINQPPKKLFFEYEGLFPTTFEDLLVPTYAINGANITQVIEDMHYSFYYGAIISDLILTLAKRHNLDAKAIKFYNGVVDLSKNSFWEDFAPEPYKSALKYNQIYDPIRISYFIIANYHGNKPLLIITPVLNQCLASLLLLEEQTYCYFISVPKVAWSRFSIEKEVALSCVLP